MYDYPAILADFEAWLLEDGRQSHGTAHLTAKLAELRARHRVVEGADEAALRRFGAGLLDDFIGRLPADEDPATDDPLTARDREAHAAMDEGAATDPTTEGDPCPPKHPKPPPRPASASRPALPSTSRRRRPVAATT